MSTTKFDRPLPAARREVLDTLKALFPAGISSVDLIEKHGPSAKSRIGDLITLDGYGIDGDYLDGIAYYRLVSLTPTKLPDPVHLGVKARAGASTGLSVELYADCRGKLAPEVEARLLAKVRAAMDEALATLAPPAKSHEDECMDALIDALDALGGRLNDLRTAVHRSRR